MTPGNFLAEGGLTETDLTQDGLTQDDLTQDDLTQDDRAWYLGIDMGTTAIAATLCCPETAQQYPLHWGDLGLRLPVLAYQPLEAEGDLDRALVVGDAAQAAIESAIAGEQLPPALVLQDFKPFLNLAVPYRLEQTWQPQIQWNDRQSLSLAEMQQAIVALLSTMCLTNLRCGAVNLSDSTLRSALAQLAGVVLSCPAGWSEAYRFNLREAVLQAGLVDSADRIFFLESTIAILLPQLSPAAQTVQEQHRSRPGATLVLDAGASTTELLLVNLPPAFDRLDRQDLYLRSVAYGGQAIDQDILAQLLYSSALEALSEADRSALEKLPLPLPGELDQPTRHKLQQRLRNSPLEQNLLEAARQLKLHPQNPNPLTLPDQDWLDQKGTIARLDLDRRVIAPYVQRLNRELNTFLSQSGLAAETIVQAIYTGGSAKIPAIGHWLRQKLPNARLTQLDGNPVAEGLSLLPRYPQVLNTAPHQYSEFFLLREVLQTIPAEKPVAIGRILQLLESRGINTQVCQRAILSLLEGLPNGLLPQKGDGILLDSEAADPIQLGAVPLFSQQGSQYCLNAVQRDRLLQHFSAILAHSQQTLEDPLSCDLYRARSQGEDSAQLL